MTEPILTIPPLYPWPGESPALAEGAYTGYYDSGTRQLVFVFDDKDRTGLLYLSGTGWNRTFTLLDGRLPQELLLNGNEAGWALACWRAAFGHRS